jgi:carboxyl-terminal processing protease
MRKLILIGVLGIALLALPEAGYGASSDTYRQLNLFGDVFERVRSDFVEEVDDAELIDAAINGMLSALDPHSSYLNPKRYREMQVQTRGEFGGLGIEVTMENGLVKVVSPIDDTPAFRAGVKAGDVVTHIDGDPVLGLTLAEAVDRMRGPIDSKIVITVARRGVEQSFDLTITRAVIKIRSVRHRQEDDIAYVRVTSFNEQTDVGLKKAMDAVKEEMGDSFVGVVLDLRNNPGGLLEQAIAVSDAFLDQGEIVSTRGRRSEDTQRYNADRGDLAEGRPIIVLINRGSASASEIVAGALQDHKRALVLGTTSFGKGSVQTIIPLGSHGAMRLTTARYFTPSGRSIQATGIEPDIEVEQARVEKIDNGSRRSEADLRRHLPSEAEENGESEEAESAEEEEPQDYQLARALDLLRGLSVLGDRVAGLNVDSAREGKR